jgi:hypothetical protein
MLIGEPVAATPGLVPHDEMLTLELLPPPLVAVPPADADDEFAEPPPAALELELLLLPHPASANSARTATNARTPRARGTT